MNSLSLLGWVLPRGPHRDRHQGHFSLGALLCFIDMALRARAQARGAPVVAVPGGARASPGRAGEAILFPSASLSLSQRPEDGSCVRSTPSETFLWSCDFVPETSKFCL